MVSFFQEASVTIRLWFVRTMMLTASVFNTRCDGRLHHRPGNICKP